MAGELKAWQKRFTADLEVKLSSMDDAQLAQEYDSTSPRRPVPLPEPPTPDPMEQLADLLASTPDNVIEKLADPPDQEEYDARWRRSERIRIFDDEFRRRGLKLGWSDGRYTLVPDDPKPPHAAATATVVGGDPPLDPTIETGHYDDGHSFGWDKKDPARPVPTDGDTGHYDDGHSFGWGKRAGSEPSTDRPARSVPVPLVGAVGAGVLVIAAVGFAFASNKPGSNAVTGAPTSAASPSSTGAIAASRVPSAGAIADPCTLVNVQEASSMLAGQTVTTSSPPLPTTQCSYKPAQRVIFSFQEASRTAQIRIDSVVITIVTGAQAVSRYESKQASYGKDRDDQQVSGLGDKAIFTNGSEVSVLRGSTFINVTTTGDRDWGEGTTRYEDVHQKYLSVVVGFARTALGRAP